MTINLRTPNPETDFKPRITVVGVGGAGGNAVNNMIRASLEGVDFLVCNTDAQAMNHTLSERKLQLGAELTQGLGAGSKPDVGRAAAEESLAELMEMLVGNHMVFVTAGMGGGTGTGAAPVIARACREHGMLTVGVVTKPFLFEGRQRLQLAEQGIAELQQYVDTLIVIPNQNLFRVANEKTTFADAFKMADDVLFAGVRSVTDLMVMPGLINLDFADIRSVMSGMGKAMMGTGEAEGDKRAIEAAEAAIANPLLEDLSMKTAQGLLINITGSLDMTLMEVDEAVNRILEEVDPDADMIFGSTFDDSLQGRIRISVVATGIDVGEQRQAQPAQPVRLQTVPAPAKPVAAVEASAASAHEEPMPDVAVTRIAALAAAGEAAPETADDDARRAAATSELDAEIPAADMLGLMGAADDLDTQRSRRRDDGAKTEAPRDAEAFIPPPPIQPEDTGAPEPFAAAAMANGGGNRVSKRRKLSLFERMTGVARAGMVDRRGGRSEVERVEPVARNITPKGGPVEAARSGSGQKKLGALDPSERPKTADSDSDMLDIPAFLRRQAN